MISTDKISTILKEGLEPYLETRISSGH